MSEQSEDETTKAISEAFLSFPLEDVGSQLVEMINRCGAHAGVVILVNDQVTGHVISTSNVEDGGYEMMKFAVKEMRDGRASMNLDKKDVN